MDFILLMSAVIGGYIVFLCLAKKKLKTLFVNRFGSRELKTEEAFINEFYPSAEKSVMTIICRALAECYQVPIGLLRPSDRFAVELKPPLPILPGAMLQGAAGRIALRLREARPGLQLMINEELAAASVDDLIQGILKRVKANEK